MRHLLILSLLFSVNAMAQPGVWSLEKEQELDLLRSKLKIEQARTKLALESVPKNLDGTVQTIDTPDIRFKAIEWRSALHRDIVCSAIYHGGGKLSAPSCVRR